MKWLSLEWLQLKRMVGIDGATPDQGQEGQIRYSRNGDVNGKAYLARYLAGGTYEWEQVNEKASSTPTAPLVGVTYRTSASGNVTSTTGTNISSLSVGLTLTAGITWDLYFEGSVNANAPTADFIFAGANVESTVFGWTDTGTVSGERSLGFAGYKLGVAGDGAVHTAYCRMKVGSGTGTINTGVCMFRAIPRE